MKYSWNAKTPMTSPDMVAKPIKWNPMSEDWKKRVEAIRVKYADEDIGSNCGWYALCKGDFVDDGYPSKGNAAIDFACNIWGYDANAYRTEMSLL